MSTASTTDKGMRYAVRATLAEILGDRATFGYGTDGKSVTVHPRPDGPDRAARPLLVELRGDMIEVRSRCWVVGHGLRATGKVRRFELADPCLHERLREALVKYRYRI